MANINFYNIDNMEFMKPKPDNAYELAIVDPPYGMDKSSTHGAGKLKHRALNRMDTLWDIAPNDSYFGELFRVSKNQIIWGGNYMTKYLNPTSAWLFWDKGTGNNDFADGELAWTSFSGALRKFHKTWIGANAKDESNRIHPTQKPIALYRWILNKYAKPGDKILDTHGGSMSIAIACDMEGFDLDICEIDKDYFEDGKKRFETYRKQLSMPFPKAGGQKINIIQTDMFNSG